MRALVIVAAACCVVSLSACASDGGPSKVDPSATSSPSASPTTVLPAEPSPSGTPSTWSSGPQVVNRSIPVPPVPRLLRIRSAAHPEAGYDRIVFDFQRVLPGYDIRYVDTVIADGSGQPVPMPGRRFLQIVFRPAQAHDDSGGQTVTPRSQTLSYPMLKAYAITGDFEGVLTVHLGLDDVVGYRVGELPGEPGRVYIDVAA